MTNKPAQRIVVIGFPFALLLLSLGGVLAQEEVLLYSQDFETEQPVGWELGPGWEIAESETGHVRPVEDMFGHP